jgi:hypothetical protein
MLAYVKGEIDNAINRIDYISGDLHSIACDADFSRAFVPEECGFRLFLDRDMYIRGDEAAESRSQSRRAAFQSRRHGNVPSSLHLLLRSFEQL